MSYRHPKLVTLFLTAVFILAVLLAAGCSQSRLIEIQPPPADQNNLGQVYIGGAVAVPGLYPLKDGDTLAALLQAAGGATLDGNAQLRLIVLKEGEAEGAQLIDLNRAEAWLLQALPGIGETKARAIIDYRNLNGPFKSTAEITRVAGIGVTTYENIKELITVAD